MKIMVRMPNGTDREFPGHVEVMDQNLFGGGSMRIPKEVPDDNDAWEFHEAIGGIQWYAFPKRQR